MTFVGHEDRSKTTIIQKVYFNSQPTPTVLYRWGVFPKPPLATAASQYKYDLQAIATIWQIVHQLLPMTTPVAWPVNSTSNATQQIVHLSKLYESACGHCTHSIH